MLDEPVYVDITNVAHWFYAVNSQEEYAWEDDFPTSILPWPISVWKYSTPTTINSDGKVIKAPRIDILIRAVQISVRPEESISFVADGGFLSFLRAETGLNIIENGDVKTSLAARRVLEGAECHYMQLYAERQWVQGTEVPKGLCVHFLDGQGKTLGAPITIGPQPFETDFFPLCFAIALLHAKNVELVDKPIPRHERRRAKRRGLPLVQYKTLVIEPFKKQVRNEAAESGESGESEIHRALHICRGHFATYTEDAPLFGKYTGTYWRPMHVRGRADVGIVHKDYKIVADDKQPVAPSSGDVGRRPRPPSSPSRLMDGDDGAH